MTSEREQEIAWLARSDDRLLNVIDTLRQEHERLKEERNNTQAVNDLLRTELDSLSRQVKIAVEALEIYAGGALITRIIAVKALSEIAAEKGKLA